MGPLSKQAFPVTNRITFIGKGTWQGSTLSILRCHLQVRRIRPLSLKAWVRSSKVPGRPGFVPRNSQGTFLARKVIFNESVCKNRVHTSKTSCMKGTSNHIKKLWIKPPCNFKVWNLPRLSGARKHFGTIENRAPGPIILFFSSTKKKLDFLSFELSLA